jgi:hypothetical protein
MVRTTRLGVLWLVCALAATAMPLPLPAQEVTLPLSQYEQLRSRAHPKPDDPAPPPARFALESADLEIAVGSSSARIVQKLVLSVLSDTWERVPLGEAGSFTSARFGSLEGRVEVSEKEGWALQVHGRGRHEVTLESVVPVRRDETSTRPASSFSLRLPPAAVLRGKLQTPPGIDEVTLTGKGLVRGAAGGPWTFVAAFEKDAGVTFTLFGQRTLPERAQLPLRFDATSATAAVLSRTQLRVRGWIEARVAQGRLTELRIPVPADLQLVSVSGPLAGWNLVDENTADGTLVITPQEPVEGTLAVELELTGEPRSAFASPVLTPAGGRRTLHLVKAALQGDGLLALTDPGAVRGPEESETARVPASIQGAGGQLRAVTDPSRPPRWEAEWAEGTEVLAAQVDRLLLDVAVGEAGRAVYRLWAEVRNRGAQQLVLHLPPGFELTTARLDGLEVAAGTAPGGGLAVPLLTREAAQAVHLDGVVPLSLPSQGKGELTLPLPALSAPAARIEVRVVLPGGRTWRLADPSRAGSIQGPPQGAPRAASTVNALAAQMQSNVAGFGSGPLAGTFLVPPGFQEITAAWSALSASPGPLMLRFESAKEANPWM